MKIKFLLHSNSFSERGDSVTLLAIGGLLKREFGSECVIAVPADAEHVSAERMSEAISRDFEVFRYRNKSELDTFARSRGVTHSYVFHAGKKTDLPYYDESDPQSFRIGDTRHITHVVFRSFDPHGEVYAYVSDWLMAWAKPRIFFWRALGFLFSAGGKSRTLVTSFPHFIEEWPTSTSKQPLRQEIGIPRNAHVIGRIGGFSEFDDLAARDGISLVLDTWPDSYAIFINTPRFLDHPRAFFLDKLSRAGVKRFYDACDVLINGRRMGESFGYSIAEPLSLGKPVIAPGFIRNPLMDKNHIKLLRGSGLLYSSAKSILRIYNRIRSLPPSHKLPELTSDFSPQGAAKKLRSMLT
jgi:glycosyltransferase involved in cell wall biosynthesis